MTANFHTLPGFSCCLIRSTNRSLFAGSDPMLRVSLQKMPPPTTAPSAFRESI